MGNSFSKSSSGIVDTSDTRASHPIALRLPAFLMEEGRENRLARPANKAVDITTKLERDLLRFQNHLADQGKGSSLLRRAGSIAEGDVNDTAEGFAVEKALEPMSPFPFMKLPPELRMMVYEFHFLQKPEHLEGKICWDGKRCGDGEHRCRMSQLNKDVPLQSLWTTSKIIYNEAMPLYFSTHNFSFSHIEDLGQFLTNLGAHGRQLVTSVRFVYERCVTTEIFEAHEAFRRLAECPNLAGLSLVVNSNHIWRKRRLPGLTSLLKIRGIEKLDITLFDPYWMTYLYSSDLDSAKEKFMSKIDILKQPYAAADIKRREAKGIIKNVKKLRTDFTGLNRESRADRLSRREALKNIA
ncbi:MAG: hypothetical protein Q9219_002314 [cf. Caloplaca sp. 3 TL-2023]